MNFLLETTIKAILLSLVGFAVLRSVQGRPGVKHLGWLMVFAGIVLLPSMIPVIGGKAMIYLPEPKEAPETISGPNVSSAVIPPPGKPTPSKAESNLVSGASAETVVWPTILGTIWFFGALVVASRYGIGWYAIHRLRRRQTDTLGLNPNELAARIGLKQNWELRVSAVPEPATAMTWGVFRPVVLLPFDAESWSAERLESVLLHELAHVRRRDFASQLLAESVCALYWFNPLVWFGARVMRETAELAADNSVLRSGVKPSTYASELLRIAAEIGNRSQPFSRIGVSVMNQPKIESRLQSVLSPSARHRGLTSVQVLATVAIAALSLSALAAVQIGSKKASGSRSAEESTDALKRSKGLAIATLMYAADYDDMFPYAQNTKTVKAVTYPYAKNLTLYDSPTPGGKFVFNLNIGGVVMISIESPAETPMWIEKLPDSSSPAVSFADGHASLITNEAKMKKVETFAKLKFGRKKGVKPLPANMKYPWDMPGARSANPSSAIKTGG